MSALRHKTSGNAQPWRFDRKPLDASMRYHWFGPILPMEQPGFFARLFGRRA